MAGRVTQVAVEALLDPTLGAVRITQGLAEAVYQPSAPVMRVSQVAVEVLLRIGGAPDSVGSVTRQRLALPGAVGS